MKAKCILCKRSVEIVKKDKPVCMHCAINIWKQVNVVLEGLVYSTVNPQPPKSVNVTKSSV